MMSSLLAAALLVVSSVAHPGVVEVPPPMRSEDQAPVPFPVQAPVPLPVEVQAPVEAPAPGLFSSPAPVAGTLGPVSYREFMGACAYFAQEEGLQGMALGVMALICHCSYKQIEGRVPLNKKTLVTTSRVCEEEIRYDHRAFILKYLDEAERNLKATGP